MKKSKRKVSAAERVEELSKADKRRNALKFAGIFAGVMTAYYLAVWLFKDSLFDWYMQLSAFLASLALYPFADGVQADGLVVHGPEYAVTVAFGCEGSEPLALLFAAILAFPIAWRYKWRGLLYGGAALFTLNIFRIAGLYLIGRLDGELMEYFHLEIFPLVFIVFAIIIWAIWITRSLKDIKRRLER